MGNALFMFEFCNSKPSWHRTHNIMSTSLESRTVLVTSSPSHPQTATIALITGCAVCRRQHHLIQCDGCRYVEYCTPEHQEVHRPVHQDVCKEIKESRAAFEVLDARKPPNNVFGAGQGKSAYLGARQLYIGSLVKSNTRIGVEEAL